MVNCKHETFIKNLCCICGFDLSIDCEENKKNETKVGYAVIHNNPELRVSYEEALNIGLADQCRLLRARKLVLILDLDHTIVHTKIIEKCEINYLEQFKKNEDPELKLEFFEYQIQNDVMVTQNYVTCIRPGTRRLLKEISSIFEIHVFTQGCREYANKVISFIDPDASLFGDRTRSRDESSFLGNKSFELRSLFPCGDSMVCIFDDRSDVWGEAKNLILAWPFVCFKNTGDINNCNKSIKVKYAHTEDPNIQPDHIHIDDQNYLLDVEEILEQVHTSFYSKFDEEEFDTSLRQEKKIQKLASDLRIIIPEMRKKILDQCNLVFTGCFSIQKRTGNKEITKKDILHPMEKIAISLGSKLSEEVANSGYEDSGVTHLVCGRIGTMKYLKARNILEIRIVSLSWLYACNFRWKHVEEMDYEITEDMNLDKIEESCNLEDEVEMQSRKRLKPDLDDKTFLEKSSEFMNEMNYQQDYFLSTDKEDLTCFADDETLLDAMIDGEDTSSSEDETTEIKDIDSQDSQEKKDTDYDVQSFADELEKFLM